MIDRKVSQRYAKGLLEYCRGAGLDLEAMVGELNGFVGILHANHQWEVFINNPSVPVSVREKALAEVVGGKVISEGLGRFLMLLFRKGRFPVLARVAQAFSEQVDHSLGRQSALVIGAHPLSSQEVTAIVRALEGTMASTLQPTAAVDPELIGGFVARVGSLQFDGSIKGQLRRFVAALAKR